MVQEWVQDLALVLGLVWGLSLVLQEWAQEEGQE
jgi:hypothetical protein